MIISDLADFQLGANMVSTSFPGSQIFFEEIYDSKRSPREQLESIFNGVLNLIEMASMMFNSMALRCYEKELIEEPEDYRKKTKQIREILNKKFVAPSLGTNLDLSHSCMHLIDQRAFSILLHLKSVLNQVITLGPIGTLLDDLNKIFDKIRDDEHARPPQYVNQSTRKMSLLDGVLTSFIPYRNDAAHLVGIGKIISDYRLETEISISDWLSAFESINVLLSPILTLPIIEKYIAPVDSVNLIGNVSEQSNSQITVKKTRYSKRQVLEETEHVKYEEWKANQWNNQLGFEIDQDGKSIFVNTTPFLLMKDGILYYYKKSRGASYQYFTLAGYKTTTLSTKRKFNHYFLNLEGGSEQSIFWTEIKPTVHPTSGVKSNIPIEGNTGFIGRKKQLRRIQEEIIEISNRDGIIYGPGGVGKTALIIELTKNLIQDSTSTERLFENIIWVSAKTNYYNPVLNMIEGKNQQFNNLDNILADIMHFFEFENVEEYTISDKKDLVLDIMRENRVLLILDNFETITRKAASDEIIAFFSLEVKKRLREKPNNFKVLITSREMIPSGFHQFMLEGLDLRESKQLMASLFETYRNTCPELTDQQKNRIHEVTRGIPIIIKHCFGQLYEFNEPLENVISNLNQITAEVVQFSYAEIIKCLQKDETNTQIILLLEKIGAPLSIRQIAEILECDEVRIKTRISPLLNLQCIEKTNTACDEQFTINDQVHILSKGLLLQYDNIVKDLSQKILKNYTLQRRMDYSMEEQRIIELFNANIKEERLLEAEQIIKDELINYPRSIYLRYHYAKYLKDEKQLYEEAISILEAIHGELTTQNRLDPNVLLLLGSCYVCQEIPNYGKAKPYYVELSRFCSDDDKLKMALGEFYINWSELVRRKKDHDPNRQIENRTEKMSLASQGTRYLEDVKQSNRTHRFYYFSAIGRRNTSDREGALNIIDKALQLSMGLPIQGEYRRIRAELINDIER